MAKKKCKCKEKEEEYGILYYQGSNPRQRTLDWLEKQLNEGKLVYFQSGHPNPPPCPPNKPNCNP